jgi:hypothetical protein
MAENDRPEDEAPQQPPPKPKRRRRPPTIDLTAKEVGADDQPKNDAGQTSQNAGGTPTGKPGWRERAGGFTGSSAVAAAALTGLGGAALGALVVYLLVASGGTATDPRVAELTGEIAKLSARVESLTARPAPAPVVNDSSALIQRLDRLTAAIGESEQRLAAIEKRPPPQPADLSGVNQRTAAIEDTLKDLRGALGELRRAAEQTPPAATPQAVEQLSSRMGGLEQRIAALAAPRVAAAASSLADDLISLNALAVAVQSGRPFAKELDAARARLGDRAAPLAKIEPFAAKGLPTTAVLADQFSDLADDLLRGPEPESGFFSRLVANATRLVEVRQVGEPAGSSAGAIIARTETKLGHGDLAGAIAEVEALPEPAKSKAADWLATAKQRRDVDQLLKSFIDASLMANAERAKP